MLGGISRITPACAGSTSHTDSNHGRCKDHPRLRGEYAFWFLIACPDKGSPPLARGVLEEGEPPKPKFRITPACAGSTVVRTPRETPIWDHPRLRGEYAVCFFNSAISLGSPPLARGVRIDHELIEVHVGITPACAGSTLKKA